MSRLPVIVGFGGINPAGRSSSHHGYKRLVFDALAAKDTHRTLLGNALMMGKVTSNGHQFFTSTGVLLTPENTAQLLTEDVMAGTLIREFEPDIVNTSSTYFNTPAELSAQGGDKVSFIVKKTQIPNPLPKGWSVSGLNTDDAVVVITGKQKISVPLPRKMSVNMAGQLPSGFNIGTLYNGGDKHPKGLQMSVYAASDALGSVGIAWDDIQAQVPADQVSVYASSLMGQWDDKSFGGMVKAWLSGEERSNKQVAFGLGHMPADFVNSYITGSVGSTGGHIGACASFLYNLEHAVRDIQEGRCRVAVVGSSEAPLTPECIEGYSAAGAATTDDDLRRLDRQVAEDKPNYRSACRPFNDNAGLVLSESSQYVVLFDDLLAHELGAEIYGAVPAVYINADGFKKSIYAPGAGNYITFAKSAAMIEKLIGAEGLRSRTFVHAHGTGTPLNRKTEAEVINKVAAAFKVDKWHVTAIKSYLGHSLGVAAGDQLANTMGVWKHSILPGIATLDQIAGDVDQTHINLSQQHIRFNGNELECALINAKGFGGNNATAVVMSPQVVERYLHQHHDRKSFKQYEQKREKTREHIRHYDDEMLHGRHTLSYTFGKGVINDNDIEISANAIDLPGLGRISLNFDNPYGSIRE